MPYRNKTYVAFDGDTDMWAYAYMKGWKQNDNSSFNFYNAHDLSQARDTSREETIKRQLRMRLTNSKIFVLLVGEHTKNLYKFVRWEIEEALKLQLPVIVVNLNQKKQFDDQLCPPLLRNELAIHISFHAKILQYALENWGALDAEHRRNGESGPYWYKQSVYDGLGLE